MFWENYGLRKEETGWRAGLDADAVEEEGKVWLRLWMREGEAVWMAAVLLMEVAEAEAEAATEVLGG